MPGNSVKELPVDRDWVHPWCAGDRTLIKRSCQPYAPMDKRRRAVTRAAPPPRRLALVCHRGADGDALILSVAVQGRSRASATSLRHTRTGVDIDYVVVRWA